MNPEHFPCSTITLIRHGRPDFWQIMSADSVVSTPEIPDLIRRYDASGIVPASVPPDTVIQAAQTAVRAYSSDLKRARESARILGLGHVIEQAIFREVELPILPLSFLRLPIFLWLIILRCLWFSGYARFCESFRAARLRAAQAAGILAEAAQKHGHVALVGHSFLNRFIKQALLRAGWEAGGNGQNTHWGMHQLVKRPAGIEA